MSRIPSTQSLVSAKGGYNISGGVKLYEYSNNGNESTKIISASSVAQDCLNIAPR